jgi:hypothetical protein
MLLQENIGKTFQDISLGNECMDRTPIGQEIRAKIDKWNCIKLKSFFVQQRK